MVLLSMDTEYWTDDDWAAAGDTALDGHSLAAVLADTLDESYADATDEELVDAFDSMVEEMSAAEAFSFAKALGQIQREASRAVADPAFAQIVGKVAPTAGGALGTVIGGPLGTAVGSQLGSAAAKALARPGVTGVGAAGGRPTAPPLAGGSTAAARGLVLTQQPDVLKALLGLAMGQHGRQTVSGVPVASIMGMLSSVFGQAAEDADELMYLTGDDAAEAEGTLGADDTHRSIYTTLLDTDNEELAEAWESSS